LDGGGGAELIEVKKLCWIEVQKLCWSGPNGQKVVAGNDVGAVDVVVGLMV